MPKKFRDESLYSWYAILIFMSCFAVGELGHFLIGIVSKPMSQDLKFGEQGCIVSEDSLSYEDQQECITRNNTVCLLPSVNNTILCEWNFLGSGIEYQLLAGPAFAAIFSVMGIILGILGDMFNRIRLLSICVFMFSSMAVLTGFCKTYWQLVIVRIGYGAGEAGCAPLSASIVGDLFGKRSRALAMSVFNWGIYLGYGLAFTVGSYVTQANILNQGWRWSYFLTGIPGFIMGVILFLTVKDPEKKEICVDSKTSKKTLETTFSDDLTPVVENKKVPPPNKFSFGVAFHKLTKVIKTFVTNPAILMLLLASAVRHSASFSWAYNTQLYFNYYHPGYNIAVPMMLCSIIGGSIGIASGGIISDLMVSKYGVSTRLWVLVVSQALASPLAAMVLYLPPPYCFITLCCAYLFAEMWYGVVMTVFIEVVPADIRSTAVAVFTFTIANIGGNFPVVVPYLKQVVGGLRNALYITYPGFYLLSSVLFCCTQLLIRSRRTLLSNRDIDDKKEISEDEAMIKEDTDS